MPTLQFKGKNVIWNHHLSVPYHALEEVEELDYKPEQGAGNLIVEGDNLLALKALLPQYAGKVKCIYIDPPYNTGNEGWAYNDKVNSLMIKEWLGRTVDKEDLTRHDKWLCMMVPRLKLLRELLSEDGVIFISIDDNEVHNLRAIMGEIYGEDNFICNMVREGKTGSGHDSKFIAVEYDYILVAGKNLESVAFNKKKVDTSKDLKYKYEDKHVEKRGKYYLRDLDYRGSYSKSLDYPISLSNGEVMYAGRSFGEPNAWRWSKEKFEWGKENDFIVIDERKKKVYIKQYEFVDNEDKPRERELPFRALVKFLNTGGTREVANLSIEGTFAFPKPERLIRRIIEMVTHPDDLVLDSFAGSGTTMHAVMALNKEDGGNRKCIMVQMTEATEKESNKNICRDITRERVKRAIEKYDYQTGFKYLRVGASMDAEDMLAGQLPSYDKLAEYVFYLATGTHLKDPIDPSKNYVGEHGSYAVYLLYEPDFDKLTNIALTQEIAEKIIAHQPKKRKIIYAPACFVDEEYMEERKIAFVSVPYSLFQRRPN